MADIKETGNPALTEMEIDAIGEVLNISMGSAATAISTMLDKQVDITIPKVELQKFHDVSYAAMEPAILVKIEYVEGISGCNVMVFRQSDMQVILNLLMGIEDEPSEDFVFDEMSMSAACEVMNQMMGASATALSNFLGKTVNISTPEAVIMDDMNTFEKMLGLMDEDDILSTSFNINVEKIMSSEFISVMTCHLAKDIISQIMTNQEADAEVHAAKHKEAVEAANKVASVQQQTANNNQSHQANSQMPNMQSSQPYNQMPQQPNQMQVPPEQYNQMPPQQMGMPPQMPPYPDYSMMQQGMPPQQMPYPMPPYGYYPPYGYQPMQGEANNNIMHQGEVNVQIPKFPSFAGMQQPAPGTASNANMDLMMNVPLNVSVEIGKTKKKIKDIMDFVQGTVIELEKQAGAPVDIVVNGQLIARGDVVVVEDNFGVRITEIIGTKELVDALENNS